MDLELYSEIFKALGHPVRLKIVKGLIEHEHIGCNVNKMVEQLALPQSTVSQHLATLRNAGIIKPNKTGVSTCYVVNNEKVRKIIELIEG